MITITENQLNMMRHAVGLDWGDKPYRNHFDAGPGDEAAWDDLVKKGLASKGTLYHLTPTGFKWLGLTVRDYERASR